MGARAGRARVPGVEVVQVVHVHLDVDGDLKEVGERVEVGQAVLVVVVVLLLLHGLLLLDGERRHGCDGGHIVDISRLDHQGLVIQDDTFGVYGGEAV